MSPSSVVYPIGVLVMGVELKLEQPRTTLSKLRGEEPDGPLRHRVIPFCYNVMRFAAAGSLVPFIVVRSSSLKAESIHALGPALIERVILAGVVLYDKEATTDSDGKLFYCPHRTLEYEQPMQIQIRCLPELFMLGGRNVEQVEAQSAAELELARGHDPTQCDDCVDFRRRTGMGP